MNTEARLRKKYMEATVRYEEHSTVFEELDASLNVEHRAQWTEMERNALQRRIADPSAMDVFDVKIEKCNTTTRVDILKC